MNKIQKKNRFQNKNNFHSKLGVHYFIDKWHLKMLAVQHDVLDDYIIVL